MTIAKIQGFEKNIASIFGDEFAFEIPHYQRPYAWTTENAEELLTDLAAFLEDEIDIEDIDPYFLGSIVLIKESAPESKVVDGQQRLTTLTILLSVLRELADEEDKAEITPFIYEKGNKYSGSVYRPRLRLRERDREFFQKYIQGNGDGKSIANLVDLDPTQLDTDSQRNIRSNALHLKALLENMDVSKRERLAEFILKRCYLVVVAAPERDTAYRIFSVLNRRGLDLSPTDILKADIIGEIDKAQQEAYTKKWEDNEEMLGRENFSDLFAHIRMISRKLKAQGTTLEEIRKHIAPQDNPVDFIDNQLIPLCDAFYDIKYEAYESKAHAEQLNHIFQFLNQIDNFDWVPPAILYLSKHKGYTERLIQFFTGLERLAASMMIMRIKINDRIKRYGSLLSAIEADKGVEEALELSSFERNLTKTALNGDVYNQSFARYVLLRLDTLISTTEARYNYPVISIEHVLPQHPSSSSAWVKLFPDPVARDRYTNCLGNLVLLSRRKNSQARNYDFERKKNVYFNTASAPFALTAYVRDEETWTPDILDKRQKYLLGLLTNAWGL